MEFLNNINQSKVPFPILDSGIPSEEYCPIDLSTENKALDTMDISNTEVCQNYVTAVLKRNSAKVAYGGYLEKRNLYGNSPRFQEDAPRNIHLGMDFWCEAGTRVLAPLDGKIHSFANNADFGNYGPTIILEHDIKNHRFYTLYGHLSLESLKGFHRGKNVQQGDALAFLGTAEVNVGYAPHLHFQIIVDLGNYDGDYPGVCTSNELEFFKTNCPNPNILLGYPV